MRLYRAVLFCGLVFVNVQLAAAETNGAFRSTYRLPDGEGHARIATRHAGTLIHIDVNDMKPAALFGGDLSTYVLWGISSRGEAANLIEVRLDGDSARLAVETTRTPIALIVTAEPHFLVTAPSRFVVLEFAPDGDPVEYRGYDGRYNYERDTLAGVLEATKPVRADIQQAWTAVQLAHRVNAGKLAPSEMETADKSLDLVLKLSRQGNDRHADERARETVRLAVNAQRKAREEETAQFADREAFSTRRISSRKQ